MLDHVISWYIRIKSNTIHHDSSIMLMVFPVLVVSSGEKPETLQFSPFLLWQLEHRTGYPWLSRKWVSEHANYAHQIRNLP